MRRILPALFVTGIVAAAPAAAQDLDITVTNLTHATYFTPLLVAAHPSGTHVFQAGAAASANLQAMAEGGDISGLSSDLDAVGADKVEDPAGGFLAPGASASTSLSTAAANDHLSLVGMLLPTNDGFVGLDGLEIPAGAGTYTYTVDGYDAGTEANNELIVNGSGTPGVLGIPADPGGNAGTGGTGVTATEANTTIHIHRGVLGDSNGSGGSSDLDSAVHRWSNPVAKVVITVN